MTGSVSPHVAFSTPSVRTWQPCIWEAGVERDPVCGIELMPGKEEAEVQYEGRTYHFCSRECRDLFVKNPADYLKEEAQG